METPRHTTVRLVRNQSINLTTGVVTEGDVVDVETVKIQKAQWISNLIDQNDPSGIYFALRDQSVPVSRKGTDRNWTVSEGAKARNQARRNVQIEACFESNDLRALSLIFNKH